MLVRSFHSERAFRYVGDSAGTCCVAAWTELTVSDQGVSDTLRLNSTLALIDGHSSGVYGANEKYHSDET